MYLSMFWTSICESPTQSFRLLTLQASKEKIKLSNTTFRSQNGEVVGERYAQFRAIGPICPGGGGLHGDDHININIYIYICGSGKS